MTVEHVTVYGVPGIVVAIDCSNFVYPVEVPYHMTCDKIHT